MDDEDTVVVPQNRKEIVLIPLNPSLRDELTIHLTEPARIGRQTGSPGHNNFYGVTNKVVSRNHIDIWEKDGRYYIKDLGSAAGTYLNGNRLSQAGVQSSAYEIIGEDKLQLGTNYVEDPAQLNQDSSLRCFYVKIFVRGAPKIARMPTPPHSHGAMSDNHSNSGIDLNNLTHIIKAQIQKESLPNTPPSSISPNVSRPPLSIPMPNAVGTPPVDSKLQNELQKKRELEEKLKDMQLKTSNSLTSLVQKDQYVVAVVRQSNKITKISVQASGKDVFTVNIKAWDSNKKLLIQDHRCQFSRTPYLELMPDNKSSNGLKYVIVNHNGGALIATIDKQSEKSALVQGTDGCKYQVVGDLGESYRMFLDGKLIAEVMNVENLRNPKQGNLSRILNVNVEKDHNHQLILSAVVIIALITA
jgi:hypothetical protein